jgi:membrane-bound serine protease (ClpP class)
MWRSLRILAALSAVGSFTDLRGANVGLIKIAGAIGPATANYVSRGIGVAEKQNDSCLIIQMDTPGGLLDSTKEIVQTLYASAVPTIVYVAPSGANAASAGCFITLAADIAAMAPNTSIGAAHPVSMGPGGTGNTDEVMKTKLENYGSSYIEAIAQKRGRNVEWAKSAVRESASITAEKALELKVIEVIAGNIPDLLKQIDGRTINGHTLKTAQANVIEIPMSVSERFFQMLWRPEVMFVLMLAAIYGIIGELSNPGVILPGVIGGIALILALYMAAILPVSAAGLALVGLSVVLFIADVYAPTHGVLTFGGIISFFLGAMMLFGRAGPAFQLSLVYIVPATVVTALFFVLIVGAGLRAQRLPVRVGTETMLGKTVSAVGHIDKSSGRVFVEGEYWNASSDTPVQPGEAVEIIAIKGLSLKVKPKDAVNRSG